MCGEACFSPASSETDDDALKLLGVGQAAVVGAGERQAFIK
jgi:hypothetical protein